MMNESGQGGRAEVNDDSVPSSLSDCLLYCPCTSECACDEMTFYADAFDKYYHITADLAKDSEAVKK